MALASPSFARSDPCMQYFGGSSAWTTDSYSSPFPCLFDFDFPSVPPPALLPSGAINFPSCPPPLEPHQPVQMATSGAMLSTPTMHPKLVNTLKSMISPSPTSSSDISGGTAAGGGCGRIIEASSRRCINKRKHGLMQQQQHSASFPDMYSLTSSPDQFYPHHLVGGVEDDEAAVVPVDLIQNRRPFKCAYSGCNKTFKNPQTMKMHHKTHYSEDSSYRLPDVNAHVLSTFRAGHNKKIPSRCPICRKTFVGLYELRRHYGRKHSVGEKKFGCKKCGKKFYIEVDLRDHEKLCGEPIECKCGMKFAFKCNLVAHKKGHPECQDAPIEEEQSKSAVSSKQQQRRTQSRSSSRSNTSSPARAVKVSQVTFCGLSSSQSLPQLASVWSPVSPSSEDFSTLAGFSPDAVSFSSDCSYPSVTSSYSTPLSSRSSSGILFGSSYIV